MCSGRGSGRGCWNTSYLHCSGRDSCLGSDDRPMSHDRRSCSRNTCLGSFGRGHDRGCCAGGSCLDGWSTRHALRCGGSSGSLWFGDRGCRTNSCRFISTTGRGRWSRGLVYAGSTSGPGTYGWVTDGGCRFIGSVAVITSNVHVLMMSAVVDAPVTVRTITQFCTT